jgi:hypothetical protein
LQSRYWRTINDSIAKRREFRLADVDRLLFGNKIVSELN